MVFDNHCSLCFAKQIPSEIGLHQDDFSNEKSVLTDTKLQATLRLLSASTDGLRLPLFHAILHLSLQLIGFYSPSLRRISVSTGGLRLLSFIPILHLSLPLIVFTVLRFAELASSCNLRLSSFMPILHIASTYCFHSPSLR